MERFWPKLPTRSRRRAAVYQNNRKYFALLDFCQEVAKPRQQRTMPMEYHPDPDGIAVYQPWRELNPERT